MFCGNCGNQIPDNVKFCPICGQLTDGGEAESQGVSQQPYVEQPYAGMVYGENINPPQEASKKKKGNIGLIVGCVAAVVVLIAVVVVVGAILVVKKGNEDTSEARRSSRTEKEAESSEIEGSEAESTAAVSAMNEVSEEAQSEDAAVEETSEIADDTYEYVDSEINIYMPFSDGYAWVESNGKLYCIDETGKEMFKLDESYSSPSEWYNGYSLVDNQYVIDTSGAVVCTVDTSEYEIYDYQALDVGRIILSKYIDEYDVSGTFYYVLNVETSDIEEIDLSMSNYFTEGGYTYEKNGDGVADNVAKLGEYLGYGKYFIVIRPSSFYSYTNGPYAYSTIQLYDAETNSIQGCEVDDYGGKDIVFYDTDSDNKKYLRIDLSTYYGAEIVLMKFDIEDNTIEKIESNYKMLNYGSRQYTEIICNDLYRIVCDDSEHIFFRYLDLYSGSSYVLHTEYEDSDVSNMEYEVIGYHDGIFILSMKNDAGSLYFSIVDGETDNTILKTTHYSKDSGLQPSFVGENIVYYDGESYCFLNAQTGEMINELTVESRNVACYSLGDQGFFTYYDGDVWRIYDNTGSLLGTGELASGYKADQLYYEVYNCNSSEYDEFWDINGNKLTIALYD